MKDILKKFGFIGLLLVSACDLDGDLEDPNQITPSNADVDLIMNGLQLDFANFFNEAQTIVNPLVRMEAMTGGFRYQTANTPEGANTLWSYAYEDVIVNADLVISLAEPKNLTTHVAVAKTLKAYVYLTLVDVFGDVPDSEAIAGSTGNFNPVADGGEAVYNHAIALLGEARTELAKTGTDAGAALARDVYYSGSRANWTALVNTLELKAWMNLAELPSRKAEADTKIAGLLTSNLIDTRAENFTYKYSNTTNPVSRHPLYRQYYAPTKGGAGGYIANYFLYEMFGKWDPASPNDPDLAVQDPRWRYYFYRQVGSIDQALAIDPKSLGCAPGAPPDHYTAASVPMFCVLDPGFYGRDHGDGFGTPPDGPVLTCAGVYPAGGKIDNTSTANATYAVSTIQGDGADGAGIEPIWMSWYTDFIKAELLAGNAANAKLALETAIKNSITEIRFFATSKGQTLSAGREPSTDAYWTAVSGLYDAASTKLDVIGKEYYLSLWGNGVEAYNLYRRTSAPRNMQPTLQLNPGPFYRSYVYPANYANLNDNAEQKDFNATNKVFWDTNTDELN